MVEDILNKAEAKHGRTAGMAAVNKFPRASSRFRVPSELKNLWLAPLPQAFLALL
jgi:hypothetical protein